MSDDQHDQSQQASRERPVLVALRPRRPWSEISDAEADDIVDAMFAKLWGDVGERRAPTR